jgi:hypothetical protein
MGIVVTKRPDDGQLVHYEPVHFGFGMSCASLSLRLAIVSLGPLQAKFTWLGDQTLSREEQIKLGCIAPTFDCDTPEPFDVPDNIALQLDEIAKVEAVRLAKLAHRAPGRRELYDLAGRIYDARRTRDKMLGDKLFGEPAWDMLLALYCLPPRGELLGVKGLTHAAGVPETTGLRWQGVLMDEGLIERVPPNIPPRKQFIRLTTQGRVLMDGYLMRLFYCKSPKPVPPNIVGG